MSFRFVTADDQGHLYAVTATGDLLYYRDEARDGTSRWSFDGVGQAIGHGWDGFRHVFSGGDGIIYAVTATGDLLYYRDEARDGTSRWSFDGVGQAIGHGWDGFRHVFSGGDGIIYAVTATGDLLYYRDEARDGTSRWSFDGVGQAIGHGWDGFRHVFSGGDGIIYAVTATGDLLYYRDEARDGTSRWSFDGVGRGVGTGWNGFWMVFYGGGGIVYAITTTGTMFYYRDDARDGSFGWAFNGAGKVIGSGWETEHLEGYCWPLSASPGDTIDFYVSADTVYNFSFVRLDGQPADGLGSPIGASTTMASSPQVTAPDWTSSGCGWSLSYSFVVPADWASGIYAGVCTGPDGEPFYIVFIVRPVADRRGNILVLASVNTWNAYNSWGGYSKYGPATAEVLTFLRPNPAVTPIDDGVVNHLTRADLWIVNWLQQAGQNPDVITDQDLHVGFTDLLGYPVLVLLTHPEYWSLEMLDHLQAFLEGGGSVLYLGGNGLFERCIPSSDGRALTFFNGDPALQRPPAFLRNLEPPRPERQLLGVAFRFDHSWGDDPKTYRAYPYRVEAPEHALFTGTSLQAGDLIGATGRQGVDGGGASGWEMDTSRAGAAPDGVVVTAYVGDDRGVPPANLQLLARGINADDHSADMTYYDTGHGGFVFAVGSICFGGSLVVDLHLQRIVSNALHLAHVRHAPVIHP